MKMKQYRYIRFWGTNIEINCILCLTYPIKFGIGIYISYTTKNVIKVFDPYRPNDRQSLLFILLAVLAGASLRRSRSYHPVYKYQWCLNFFDYDALDHICWIAEAWGHSVDDYFVTTD